MSATEARPAITALVCCNDGAAIGALHVLSSAGIGVHEEVSVVAFDDVGMASAVRPALTTYQVYRELFGAMAVRRVIERFKDPAAPSQAVLLGTTLVERASTRRLA